MPRAGDGREGEGREPLQQFERFADTAAGPVTKPAFTAAEGGDSHGQIGNLSLERSHVRLAGRRLS